MATIVASEDEEYTAELFLFANGRSGGNKAQKYLNLQVDTLVSSVGEQHVRLRVFNMTDGQARRSGIRAIGKRLATGTRVRAFIAGGDGSLIWLLEECLQQGLTISRIEFGILPFGTGNDLAAAMDWGRSPPSPVIGAHLVGLNNCIEDWVAARPENFDVWEIEVEVEDSGHFEVIKCSDEGFERKHLQDDQGEELKVYRRLMTNYFSFGLDARIGVGFEKKRSKSRTKNKCIYFWEGLKKTCCLSVPRIPQLATQFTEESHCVFDNTEADSALPEDASVFLALNIRTYGGGDNFVWNKSRKQLREKSFVEPTTGDRMLEFLVFRGKFDLAVEQVVAGRAYKVHQGHGPFELKFTPESSDKRFYMQVDGEFFYAIRPKAVRITWSPLSDELHLLRKAQA